MSQPNGKYTVDRREGNMWVLEFEDSSIYLFSSLPRGAVEGDKIIKDGDKLTLISAEEEKKQIKDRMDRLFKKRR